MSAAEKMFGGAGQKAGLEIWRIEKLQAVRQKPNSHGNFFAGDSYIVLHTKVSKDNYEWHIHFWLGQSSSQDEKGAAALLTVELDDFLGGAPIQHREVQGHESPLFLSYFKNGIKVLEGGIDSGFNHVDPNKYDPRLLQLKGKRDVRVTQVKLSFKSLNEGDVFILDAGLTIYQWNGKHSNKYEKFKGLQMVTEIKDNERGGKPEVQFLDQGVNDKDDAFANFWKILGGDGPIASADSAGDDDEHKMPVIQLHKLSDASGKLVFSKVAQGKLERSMLDENDVFILDNGTELFIWVGKGSNKNEKKKSIDYATEYLKKNNRPDWSPISRIVQNGETPVFKSYFKVWEVPKKIELAHKPVKVAEAKSDVSALYSKKTEVVEPMLDDGKGKTKIWRIEDLKTVPVPENTYGQFYAGDSYIVLYEYEIKGKPFEILYFWQGRDSSTDEKTASAFLTVQMDDELTAQGKNPTQVRIVMGKEPNHFLCIFKGKFIVHHGGKASGFKNRKDKDTYDTDGIQLYHVRATNELNAKAIQVEEKAISLNSGDVFVLTTPKTMYIWFGKGATKSERKYAEAIADVLKGPRHTSKVEEGLEPKEFWDFIGGKTEYPTSKVLEAGAQDPRLFQGSNRTGIFLLEEIYNFTQEDLNNEDVFLLDTYTEVWVWVGSDANAQEKTEAFEAALEYVKHAPDGRSPDTPVMKVDAGKEPPLFTTHFLGWDDAKSMKGDVDPYLEKLRALKGEAAVERITSVQQVVDFLDPKSHKFTYEELKAKSVKKVNLKIRHEYLSDDEFKKVFGVSLAEFNKFPEWKKKQLRTKAGLF